MAREGFLENMKIVRKRLLQTLRKKIAIVGDENGVSEKEKRKYYQAFLKTYFIRIALFSSEIHGITQS